MDTNILVALAPIIVAIGGGLAFLAYAHPREYSVLSRWLVGISVLLSAGGLVWFQSSLETYKAIMGSHAVPYDKIDQVSAAVDAVSLPWWWFPAILVGLLYVAFLSSFPGWIPDVARRFRQTQSDEDKKE